MEILHIDDDILVVFKPAWLLVHRGMDNDEDTLVDRVRAFQGGGKVHPMHRLDRQTSGAVVFARSPEATRILRVEFDEGRVEKTYLAMVRGKMPEEGFIDHPVPKSEKGERVPAQTAYRRLGYVEILPREVSLVECKPVTGRFHQLRRHMSHLHHPILLDANYGPTKLNRAFKKEWGLSRLTLHASRIEFTHPMSQERVVVDAPLPDCLLEPWTKMGIWPPE